MANEKIKQNYKNIANAIRAKTGENGVMTAEEMPSKIESISTGIEPSGTISITSNGDNIDVSTYANANVNVPNPSTGTLPITQNGGYNVKNYAWASVSVPTISDALPRFDTDDAIASLAIIETKLVESEGYEYPELFIKFNGQAYADLNVYINENGEYEGNINYVYAHRNDDQSVDGEQVNYDYNDYIKQGQIYLPIIMSNTYKQVNVTVSGFICYPESIYNEQTGEDEQADVNGVRQAFSSMVEAVIYDALGNVIAENVNLTLDPSVKS